MKTQETTSTRDPALLTTAYILRNTNTEVKALSVVATPQDETDVPASVVAWRLDCAGAYKFANAGSRLKVGKILADIDDEFVSSRFDQEARSGRGSVLVTKEGFGGRLITAMSGALLRHSIQTNIPTRDLTGERLCREDGIPAIYARLAVLGALFEQTDAGAQPTTQRAILDQTRELGLHRKIVRQHLGSLAKKDLIEGEPRSINGEIRFPEGPRWNGSSTAEDVGSFLDITRVMTTPSHVQIEDAMNLGSDILKDKGAVPYLVQRSFRSSGHFEKRNGHL